MSGAPAQPMPKVAPQTYGQGVELNTLNAALPTPNMHQAQPAPQPTEAQGAAGTASSEPAPPGYDHEAAMAAATGMRQQTGLLLDTTAKPNEPVTAGLMRGPGPGPEALSMENGSPAGDMLRRLSQTTGDPYFAELAAKAGA
jgi:hypothetical protein